MMPSPLSELYYLFKSNLSPSSDERKRAKNEKKTAEIKDIPLPFRRDIEDLFPVITAGDIKRFKKDRAYALGEAHKKKRHRGGPSQLLPFAAIEQFAGADGKVESWMKTRDKIEKLLRARSNERTEIGRKVRTRFTLVLSENYQIMEVQYRSAIVDGDFMTAKTAFDELLQLAKAVGVQIDEAERKSMAETILEKLKTQSLGGNNKEYKKMTACAGQLQMLAPEKYLESIAAFCTLNMPRLSLDSAITAFRELKRALGNEAHDLRLPAQALMVEKFEKAIQNLQLNNALARLRELKELLGEEEYENTPLMDTKRAIVGKCEDLIEQHTKIVESKSEQVMAGLETFVAEEGLDEEMLNGARALIEAEPSREEKITTLFKKEVEQMAGMEFRAKWPTLEAFSKSGATHPSYKSFQVSSHIIDTEYTNIYSDYRPFRTHFKEWSDIIETVKNDYRQVRKSPLFQYKLLACVLDELRDNKPTEEQKQEAVDVIKVMQPGPMRLFAELMMEKALREEAEITEQPTTTEPGLYESIPADIAARIERAPNRARIFKRFRNMNQEPSYNPDVFWRLREWSDYIRGFDYHRNCREDHSKKTWRVEHILKSIHELIDRYRIETWDDLLCIDSLILQAMDRELSKPDVRPREVMNLASMISNPELLRLALEHINKNMIGI